MDLSNLTGLFVGLHAVLAMQMQTPEIAIDDDEGAQFMKAAQNVMRHYGVQATQKSMDFVALFGVTIGLYGPRFAAYRIRKAVEKEAKKKPRAPESGSVVDFPGALKVNPANVQYGPVQGFTNPDANNREGF